jgi:iron(III) transport system substrate-binding protein
MFFRRCVRAGLVLVLIFLAPLLACRNHASSRVVVYCAHDKEFAQQIFDDFQKQAGVEVIVHYDSEANKSVGLYDQLLREAPEPRCDVHWNNEILATIRLQRKGLLQPYASPAADTFPPEFKAKDHTWTAFAARARVLLVNTERVKKEAYPRSLLDLTGPEWKGRLAMAKPLFGTTATQAACLFQVWGAARAMGFYEKLHANDIKLPPGNKQAAEGVGAGQFDAAMTDTDDAMAEIDAKRPVEMIFPDADAPAGSDRGVLFIPNTVAMIKGCPNPEAAKKLIDFLLSPEVEIKLAKSESRQIPLNPLVKLGSLKPIETPRTAHPLPVDFGKAVDCWSESQAFLIKEFGLR